MNALLTESAPWVTGLCLAAVMTAAWLLGVWLGQRRRTTGAPPSKFGEALLALLGLLLAFTFSMSLAKHENRRQMMVNDSNAIGDFYTCASLLKEPVRGKLQAKIKVYVAARLAFIHYKDDVSAQQQARAEIDALHHSMTTLVEEAIAGGTPIVAPLVNTLNNLTSSHGSRLAAFHDRLPPSVVALLGLSAVVSMGMLGIQLGRVEGEGTGPALCFIGVVSLIMWVVVDLNQPQQGLIKVSQQPLESLQQILAP